MLRPLRGEEEKCGRRIWNQYGINYVDNTVSCKYIGGGHLRRIDHYSGVVNVYREFITRGCWRCIEACDLIGR